MTIVAAFRPDRPSTDRGRPRAVLAALTAVGRRLAASPLDNTVLQATAAPAIAPTGAPTRGPAGGHAGSRRTSGMRARWRTATAPDGTTRLEATWHPAR
ncbi:hypothetical protein [Kitasatospora sp. NPDC086791]|uniref:hypothetical protein n=1 Tax=Kitasatospora sp. NPDC086791 TaxID=3155178 RepID=UPI0034332EE7